MNAPLISAINVERLFNLYSYSLPSTGVFSDAGILYGDNGIGKSTILRLAFNLLSPEQSKGHRTYLYDTPFRRFVVVLSSGETFCAERDHKKPAVLVLTAKRGDDDLARWEFVPRSLRTEAYYTIKSGRTHVFADKTRRTSDGEERYIATLRQWAPVLFLLDADRKLESDEIGDPEDETELRRIIRAEQPMRGSDMVSRSREIALSQAMNNAAQYLARQAIIGAKKGSINVHSVYADVLRQLANRSPATPSYEPRNLTSLNGRLISISRRTKQLSSYELDTPLETTEFRRILKDSSQDTRALAIKLLGPYVSSLEERLKALAAVYDLIDRFVTTLNYLLINKRIEYRLSHGFSIVNKLGEELEPKHLSSGEQQLLLLCCHVLACRDKPSVFFIDEPEISLDVKWQRQLIQALLGITGDSRVQFLFATHSLELLAQHRERVVLLEQGT